MFMFKAVQGQESHNKGCNLQCNWHVLSSCQIAEVDFKNTYMLNPYRVRNILSLQTQLMCPYASQ